MTCELCGLEVLPVEVRIIPAVEYPGLASEPMTESDYVCCGIFRRLWEALEVKVDKKRKWNYNYSKSK
jgi:hypothetical protein